MTQMPAPRTPLVTRPRPLGEKPKDRAAAGRVRASVDLGPRVRGALVLRCFVFFQWLKRGSQPAKFRWWPGCGPVAACYSVFSMACERFATVQPEFVVPHRVCARAAVRTRARACPVAWLNLCYKVLIYMNKKAQPSRNPAATGAGVEPEWWWLAAGPFGLLSGKSLTELNIAELTHG